MRVCVIPARGGSRRIPRKNIRPFHGRPIISYSIATAKASGLFDRVYVSTEDREIAEVARLCGALPILRDQSLALDHVGTQEVMADALKDINDDWKPEDEACCIYATAPLMTADDLRIGHSMLQSGTVRWVYTVGWFYWGAVDSFLHNLPLDKNFCHVETGARWIDINTQEDWARAEAMYAALHKEAA